MSTAVAIPCHDASRRSRRPADRPGSGRHFSRRSRFVPAASTARGSPLSSKRVLCRHPGLPHRGSGRTRRACDHCGHREISYNSCRNRHCPKCQALARAEWLEQREAELLPIPYFHVVFTLARGDRRLGAAEQATALWDAVRGGQPDARCKWPPIPGTWAPSEIGLLAVLHTWGQNLMHHPHLHCVVSGGGLSADESRWIASQPHYFLPVRVLSRVFRNKFRALLQEGFPARRTGVLRRTAAAGRAAGLSGVVSTAATRREWVVYAKRPFGEATCVLKYLARYTHRVAISNQSPGRLSGRRT